MTKCRPGVLLIWPDSVRGQERGSLAIWGSSAISAQAITTPFGEAEKEIMSAEHANVQISHMNAPVTMTTQAREQQVKCCTAGPVALRVIAGVTMARLAKPACMYRDCNLSFHCLRHGNHVQVHLPPLFALHLDLH
jgi:hypothetical protein